MKINELLKEGIWANYQARKQQAAGAKELRSLVANVVGKWNSYYGKTQDDDIGSWAVDFFDSELVQQFPTPDIKNSSAVTDYITNLIKAHYAGKLVKQKKSVETTPTTTQSPTIGALGRRSGTSAPSQTSKNPGEVGYTSPIGISVLQNKDPWILQYRNRNFMLNNRGEWAVDGKDTAGATASQAFQQEFDNAAGPGFAD